MVHPLGHSTRRNTLDTDNAEPEVQLRSEFKTYIKKKANDNDGFSTSSRVIQIKTTQDYFQSIKDIDSIDSFVLKKVLGCFEEIISGQNETNQVYELIDLLNK
jgi:hypothetical protein